MKPRHTEFTFEEISAAFIYEPSSGKLFRRLPNGKIQELAVTVERQNVGRFVSSQVGFKWYRLTITHIMFMLMMKRWPRLDHVIDHRDHDVFNCRWSNLREATPSQNAYNSVSIGRWVEDGLERGVIKQGENEYTVQVRANGVRRYFGTYKTAVEANAVARKAIRELQGEYSYEASQRPRPRFIRRV